MLSKKELNPPDSRENQKPIKTHWFIDELTEPTSKQGNFGVCHCPGKNLAKGRDGKIHTRNIEQDIAYFKQNEGVDIILCLLDEQELRTLGVDLKRQVAACKKNQITFTQYRIVEMGVPETSAEVFGSFLQEHVLDKLKEGKRIICHCRGGIGRAGMMACCVVLALDRFQKVSDAVEFVRTRRDVRCVESKKQMDFISAYLKVLRDK